MKRTQDVVEALRRAAYRSRWYSVGTRRGGEVSARSDLTRPFALDLSVLAEEMTNNNVWPQKILLEGI
jgi:hypothetical protein